MVYSQIAESPDCRIKGSVALQTRSQRRTSACAGGVARQALATQPDAPQSSAVQIGLASVWCRQVPGERLPPSQGEFLAQASPIGP